MATGQNNGAPMVLTPQELKLIQAVRSLEYGEVRVIIQAGKPIRYTREESKVLTQ